MRLEHRCRLSSDIGVTMKAALHYPDGWRDGTGLQISTTPDGCELPSDSADALREEIAYFERTGKLHPRAKTGKRRFRR